MCNAKQIRSIARVFVCAFALATGAAAFGQPCPTSGTGVITVNPDGSCVTGTSPVGDGPYTWDVTESGSYFMVITGVTECVDDAITVFAEASDGNSFCLQAYSTTESGTYIAEFAMPSPVCFTYLLSYKCGENVDCDNVGAYPAQGPGGACIVQLRAADFFFSEGNCQFLEVDDDCGEGQEDCIINVPDGGDLGCNPEPSEYACSLAGVSVIPQGGCTPSEVECVPGTPSLIDEAAPCGLWTVTNTYSATCGAITCSVDQVYTWSQGTTPVFDSCQDESSDLGCNPAIIPGCDAGVTAHDDCGPVFVNCAVINHSVGCLHLRRLIYTATNCAGTATCTKTYTWTQVSFPDFDNCENGASNLGCNPTSVPNCDAGVTARDECGSLPVNCDSSDSVVGCTHTRTLTYTATNCAGTSTCTRTFTWDVLTAPAFDNCNSEPTDLGCNPESIPGCDNGVTAHDECGIVNVHCDSSDSVVGCDHTRTLTYTATNCAGITTCTQTYTWMQLATPDFDNCENGNTELGCNPTSVPGCDATVTAHDECGPLTVVCESIDDSNGCYHARTITYTATNCAGTSICTRSYTWTVLTVPAFDNCESGNTELGGSPASIPDCDPAVTAHDECGLVTVSCTSSDQVDGCHHTRTLTYSANNCAGASTCTRTFTWGQGSSLTFDNCVNGTTNLGCSPATIPGPDATITASNGCGPVTVTNDGGVDTGNDCQGHTRTITYTASDTGQTITCTRTYTWTLGTITACKFYDMNANGIQDAGEVGIGNWPFTVTLNGAAFASGNTNASGCITFCGAPNGIYTVSETLSGTWKNTTPLTRSVTVNSSNCSPSVTFGNVCFVGGGNGFTLGFWSNKNGAKILTDNYVNGGGWAATLNGLNLKNENGTDFVLSTFNASNDVAVLSTWLRGANATNMANMTSAQLTATTLNTMFKGLSNASVMRVPGGMKTGANVCVVPLISVAQPITCGAAPLLALTTIAGSTSCGCASNDGLATVGDIRAKANCLLGAYPTQASAPSGSTQRHYMESVKDLLDVINNNGNAGGNPCGPASGGIQFVSTTVCAH